VITIMLSEISINHRVTNVMMLIRIRE